MRLPLRHGPDRAVGDSQWRVGAARDDSAAGQSGSQLGNITRILCQDQCGIGRGAYGDHVRVSDPITAKACVMQDRPH